MIRTTLTSGERPEPLEFTFTDADGVVFDLTGYNGAASWQRDDGTYGELSATVDELAGTVSVVLTGDVCDPPGHVVDVTLWVGNGTNRYASPVWRLSFTDPPGLTAPNI